MPAPAIVIRHARRQVEGALSVPFTYGGVALRGIWDETTVFPEDASGFDQPQHLRSLVVMTDDGPFDEDSTLVCSGTTYTVRRSLLIDDGVLTRVMLTPVTS